MYLVVTIRFISDVEELVSSSEQIEQLVSIVVAQTELDAFKEQINSWCFTIEQN